MCEQFAHQANPILRTCFSRLVWLPKPVFVGGVLSTTSALIVLREVSIYHGLVLNLIWVLEFLLLPERGTEKYEIPPTYKHRRNINELEVIRIAFPYLENVPTPRVTMFDPAKPP